MALTSFIFGGNTGETPESIARRREVQDALAAQIMGHAPTTALGGLGSILSGLALGYGRYKDNKAETAGRNSASDLFSSLLGGTAPGSTTATPDIPNSTSVPSIPGNIANARTSDRSSVPGYAPAPSMAGLDKNDVYNSFMNTVQGSVKNPYALAAIASTANAESKFSPDNANRTWADPSATDPSAMAGGLMSWNGPRLKNLQAYAASKGEKMGSISPQTQAEFFLNENPQLTSALQNAKSVQEAQSLMNNAWRFKGYNQPGGEAQQRLQSAENFLPKFQSADASTAGQPVQTSQQPVQVADNSNSIPSTTQTAQTTQQPTSALAGVDPNLIKAMMNPWLSAEQRSVIQTMINQQLQNADPMHKMELEKGRLELNALEHPKTARVLTADEKTTAGLPSDGVYQLETDGKITAVREPQKPTSAWVRMDDGRVLNTITGETKDLPAEANPAQPDAIKVLNQRADAAGLKPGSPERAQFMLNNGMPQKPSNDWTRLNDGRLYNQKTGEVKDLPAEANPVDPPAIQVLKARAKASGLVEGTPEYQQFMQSGGVQHNNWQRLSNGKLYNPQTGEVKSLPVDPNATPSDLGLNPQYGVDENGNPVLLQLGKDGKVIKSAMPEGVTLSKQPIKLDAGTDWIILDPITRQPVGKIPKNVAEVEKQKQIGDQEGKNVANAPLDLQAGLNAKDIVSSLRNDPEREWGTGLSSIFNIIPGSPGRGFQTKVNQATSGAFLTAIQQMRGLGSLSDAEGKAATAAVNRIDSSTSEKDFLDALDDYEKIVDQGISRSKQRMGQTNQPTVDDGGVNLFPTNGQQTQQMPQDNTGQVPFWPNPGQANQTQTHQSTDLNAAPAGVDPALWGHLTTQEQQRFLNAGKK